MKYVLIDNYKFTPVVHRETGDLTNTIKITYLDGPKVEISGAVDESYEVSFINADTGETIYTSTIGIGMWCASAIRYFINWKIVVKRGDVIVREDILKLKDKRVKIILDTQSMGDLIGYVGAVDAFQKKHGCSVDCVLYSNALFDIFKNSYKNIKFIPTNDDTGIIYHAVYKLGWIDEWEGKAPHNPQTISLAHNAGDILGLGAKEFKPDLKFDRTKKHTSKKYVCIAIQSTAQYKYWNHRGGWEKVVAYLKTLGYEVWCIDRDSSFGSKGYMNVIPKGVVDKTGNLPLTTRMEQINGADFFIGISSGLSWLAWAVGKPVILISGMSDDWLEFKTPHRIINKNVCHGCCNDPVHKFDKSNWLFCPRNKNFECSTQIPPEMVCREIDKLTHNNRDKVVNGFVWEPHVPQKQKEFMYEDVFVYNTYEKIFPVEDGDVVVDLGAHVGLFSYFASRNKLKKLVAVEPSKNRSAALKKNLEKFPIQIIEKGVAKEDGFVKDGLVFDGIVEDLPTVSLNTILKESGIDQIDFLKIDVEGAEYDIFTEETLDWLTTNVKKIAGEWHMETPERQEKFIKFRDTVLTKLTNYHVFSVDHIDIKWDIFHDDFITKYHEVMIHIDNRNTFILKNSVFNFDKFFEKYRTGIMESGSSRLKFYSYIIPKLVARGNPLHILETGTMWAPFKGNMGAFTLIMADLIKNHTGGRLYTVDIADKSINACKEHTKEFSDVIEYVLSDSVAYLSSLNKEFVSSLDLVYLDSYDLFVPNPHESSQHHLNELVALYPNLNRECGVAIDDNFLPNTFITWNWYNPDGTIKSKERFETGTDIIGKGKYCNKYLLDRGWTRFTEFDMHGASNLFYYENNKYTVEQVKETLTEVYSKFECTKPLTDKFLSHSKITNSASGLGDAVIMTNLCKEKELYSKFPQFKELMKYSGGKLSEPDGCFDIDTSGLTAYNWDGGHCTQRLEMAFLGKRSLVPKPGISSPRNTIKNKVGVHLATSTKNTITNSLPSSTLTSILEFLNTNGYAVVDCVGIGDINVLIEELSTCEYFVGIDSGPMHIAAGLGIKSVIILNRDDSDQIYLPKLKDVDIPNSEWLYPQNVHLSMKNENKFIKKFSVDTLRDSLEEKLYPYFSTKYVKEIQNVLASWRFDANENKLTFKLNRKIHNGVLALKELTTNLKCYHWESAVFDADVEYYVIPTTAGKLTDTDFSGFVFDIYENNRHIYSKDLVVRPVPPTRFRFYSDEVSDLKLKDHFYIQHIDFYNNGLLNKLVKPDGVVVDVGASCGTFAYNCLRKNAKKIVCLEPSPSFSILSKTFDSSVECMQAAVSTENGHKDFYFTDQSTLNTFSIDSQIKYDSGHYIKNYEKKSVECITLDSLIKKISPDKISLLKIDIEGYEYELFESISVESLDSVDQVLMEFHHNENGKINAIVNKLKVAKFSVNFMNLSYQEEDSSNSLQGVIYGVKPVDSVKATFAGNTPDGLGIFYVPSNASDKKINVKIVDTFTGLTFHSEILTVNNKSRYFLKHAYLLPNQSFRIYDRDTGRLSLEKIVNTDLEWDSTSFPEVNRDLARLIPEEQRSSPDLGFSYFEIFYRKTYALKGCKIKNGDVVFDLGANCGMFSRYAFQCGAKKVYSFEPNKSLQDCYESINRGVDYTLINRAVYSKPASFKDDPTARLGAAIIEYDPVLGDVSVNLETFITGQNIENIDYLKVDIEGAEYDLFGTITDSTLRSRVKMIALEYHENTDQRVRIITDKLTRCGFGWEFEHSGGDKLSLGMLYAIKQ